MTPKRRHLGVMLMSLELARLDLLIGVVENIEVFNLDNRSRTLGRGFRRYFDA